VPNTLKAVIAFNIIAAVLIWLIAYGHGGGFTGGLLVPPTETPPMRLEAMPAREPTAPPEVARFDVPSGGPDTPAPWAVLPDGSIRFSDDAR
jgi:hypothetical protein